MPPSLQNYHDLSYYTLAHPDPRFIHQYIVDAYTAQTADEKTKPIAITFALIGLYLAVEKKYSGREVQLAHMKLANQRKAWPTFKLPEQRGEITVSDVLKVPAGPKRDEAIYNWCVSVWEACRECRQQVIYLTEKELY